MKLNKTKKEKLSGSLEPFYSYRPKLSEDYTADDAGHDEHRKPSPRRAVYRGHEIEIYTHYEITIDREPIKVHVTAGDDGRVHCHALPNYGFRSAVDLARQLIETFFRELPKDELTALAKGARSGKKATAHAMKRTKPAKKGKAKPRVKGR